MRQLAVPADFLIASYRAQIAGLAGELAAERVAVAYLTEQLALVTDERDAARAELLAAAAGEAPPMPGQAAAWAPQPLDPGRSRPRPFLVDPGAVQRPIPGGSPS